MINKVTYKGSTYFKEHGEWLKQFITDDDGDAWEQQYSKLVKVMLKGEIVFEIINEELSKILDKKLRKEKLNKLNKI